MIRRPPRSTLFPSPPLFRSSALVRAPHASSIAPAASDEVHRSDSRRLSSDPPPRTSQDRKSTRLNSSHSQISYAVFCLKKKKKHPPRTRSSAGHSYALQPIT